MFRMISDFDANLSKRQAYQGVKPEGRPRPACGEVSQEFSPSKRRHFGVHAKRFS